MDFAVEHGSFCWATRYCTQWWLPRTVAKAMNYAPNHVGLDEATSKHKTFLESTLWWTYKKLWKITIFNGKIHYFYGHFQLQTVSSPEGIWPFFPNTSKMFTAKPNAQGACGGGWLQEILHAGPKRSRNPRPAGKVGRILLGLGMYDIQYTLIYQYKDV